MYLLEEVRIKKTFEVYKGVNFSHKNYHVYSYLNEHISTTCCFKCLSHKISDCETCIGLKTTFCDICIPHFTTNDKLKNINIIKKLKYLTFNECM